MNRLMKQTPTLKLLQKAPLSLQKAILSKANDEVIRCICDVSHNVLRVEQLKF